VETIPFRGTWRGVQICFYDAMAYGFMFMHADGPRGKGMDRHGRVKKDEKQACYRCIAFGYAYWRHGLSAIEL